MTRICYVCGKKAIEWCENLSKLRSMTSKLSISDLIKRLLNNFIIQRNIDDETNCICLECMKEFQDYDSMCFNVEQMGTKLRNLLLVNEKYYINIQETIDEIQIQTVNETQSSGGKDELPLLRVRDDLLEELPVPAQPVQPPNIPESFVAIEADVSQPIPPTDGANYAVAVDFADDQNIPVNPSGSNETVQKEPEDEPVTIIPGEIEEAADNNLTATEKPHNEIVIKEPDQCESKKECSICEDGYRYGEIELQEHMNDHQKPCQICDLNIAWTGPNQRKKKAHMQWHEENPSTCHICSLYISNEKAYKAHMELHKDSLPHQCVICKRFCFSAKRLRSHTMSHREPTMLCELCGVNFKCKRELLSHMTQHSNDRPEKCSICSKTFKNKDYLRKHKRNIHKSDRPFACSVCGMKFKVKDHCARHEKRHTENTRTLKCMFCDKAFEHKHFLNVHVKRRHEGVDIPPKS